MKTPFPRLSYAETMEKYASDKPDLRYGLEIADLTDIAARLISACSRSVIKAGGVVRGLAAPGCGGYTRHQLEELNTLAVSAGAAGLLTVSLGEAGLMITMENINLWRLNSSAWSRLRRWRAAAAPGQATFF